MMFFVTGANGSGKSASLRGLKTAVPDVIWYDFDDVGVPLNASTFWRQESTEYWISKGLEHQSEGSDVGICGHAILGEILGAPSAPKLEGIAVCFLDCDDVTRIDRLRSRGTHGATQDTLNWAAWQRFHAVDPQWRQDVIRDDSWPQVCWDRWEKWRKGDPRWRVTVINTTELTIEAVVSAIADWVAQERCLYNSSKSPLGSHWW